MLYLRSCPHCRVGAVEVDWAAVSAQFRCLNCGWMLDVDSPRRPAVDQVAERAVPSRKPSEVA